jgi:hypothetical protein
MRYRNKLVDRHKSTENIPKAQRDITLVNFCPASGHTFLTKLDSANASNQGMAKPNY